MPSTLIITEVENIQRKIVEVVRSFSDKPTIYLSLNKPYLSSENVIKEAGLGSEHIFFIDCVTDQKTRSDVLHIPPRELELLSAAIEEFIKEIPGEKVLLIDALSTLLIYNNENKVAEFVKNITTYAAHNEVQTIALSPRTRGEELLEKIFNFFDKVMQ